MENREISEKGNVGEIGIRGRVRDYWATMEGRKYKEIRNIGEIHYKRRVKQEYFLKIGKIRNFSESSENRECIENRVYMEK